MKDLFFNFFAQFGAEKALDVLWMLDRNIRKTSQAILLTHFATQLVASCLAVSGVSLLISLVLIASQTAPHLPWMNIVISLSIVFLGCSALLIRAFSKLKTVQQKIGSEVSKNLHDRIIQLLEISIVSFDKMEQKKSQESFEERFSKLEESLQLLIEAQEQLLKSKADESLKNISQNRAAQG